MLCAGCLLNWLIGVIGSKADARAVRRWLAEYLKEELQLDLSMEKTTITHVDKPARFLGYDIKRWSGERRKRVRTPHGVVLKRTCTQHLALLMPRDRTVRFARKYGRVQDWHGCSRDRLLHLSDLEIMMTFNAEVRGFMNYYALADNLTSIGTNLLWLTTSSFFRTLADKHRSSLKKEARRLKRGASRYVITVEKKNGTTKEHILLSSTKYLKRKRVTYGNVDQEPNTWQYQSRSELGQRLCAHQCEWCGTQQPPIEVHPVRKLKDVKGKKVWERQMIARRRKTMVLCKQCHVDLHAGRLTEANRAKGKLESRIR